GLTEHRDLEAAAIEQLERLERRLVPFGVTHIEREEREAELVDDFLHALLAIGELPVACHGVRLEQLEAVDHVLAERAVGHQGPLPGVAAVEEKHAVAALGAHGLNRRRSAVS